MNETSSPFVVRCIQDKGQSLIGFVWFVVDRNFCGCDSLFAHTDAVDRDISWIYSIAQNSNGKKAIIKREISGCHCFDLSSTLSTRR